MAQRVITQFVSDLSGDEMSDGSGVTVSFAYRGTSYVIDLTDEESKSFDEAMATYLDHATKTAVKGNGRRTQSKGSGRTKDELAKIRAWAVENGYNVSERGRIKREVVEAYTGAG